MSDIRKAFVSAVIEEVKDTFTVNRKIHPNDQQVIDEITEKINDLDGAKDGHPSLLDIMDIVVPAYDVLDHETLFRILVEVLTEEGE